MQGRQAIYNAPPSIRRKQNDTEWGLFRSPSSLSAPRYEQPNQKGSSNNSNNNNIVKNNNFVNQQHAREDWATPATGATTRIVHNIDDANIVSDMNLASATIPNRSVPLIEEEKKGCTCVVEPSYFCTGGVVTPPTDEVPPEQQPPPQQQQQQQQQPQIVEGRVIQPTRGATLIPTVNQLQQQSSAASPDEGGGPRNNNRKDMQVFEAVHQVRSSKRQPSLYNNNAEDWNPQQNDASDGSLWEDESALKTSLTHPNDFSNVSHLTLTSTEVNPEEDRIIRKTPAIQLSESFRNQPHRAYAHPSSAEQPHLFIRDSSLLDLDDDSEAQEFGSTTVPGDGGADDDHSVLTDDDTLYTTNSLLSQMKKYPTKPQKKRSMRQEQKQKQKQEARATSTTVQQDSSERIEPLSRSGGSINNQTKKKLLSVKGLARILSVTRK